MELEIMTLTSLEILANEHPDLVIIWDEFRRWIVSQPLDKLYELRKLTDVLIKIGKLEDVNKVMNLLQSREVIQTFIKLRDNNGRLLNDVYESVDKLPEYVFDKFDSIKLNVNDLEIVSVFKLK